MLIRPSRDAGSRRASGPALVGEGLAIGAVAIALLWTLFPLYWGALMSVRPGGESWGTPWLPWVHFAPTLASWQRLFAIEGLAAAMTNSVVIGVGSATLATAIALPTAWGIARSKWPAGWQAGFSLWFVAQRVLPPAVLLSPYLLLFRQWGMIDSVLALVLVNTALNLPLPVIVLIGAFRELPREMEEAAAVDGASRWETFRRIGVPLVLPAIAGGWLLCLAFAWNEWMFASSIAYTEAKSFPVLIQAIGGGSNIPAASSRALAALVVPVAAALVAQRWTVRALSLGAVKG